MVLSPWPCPFAGQPAAAMPPNSPAVLRKSRRDRAAESSFRGIGISSMMWVGKVGGPVHPPMKSCQSRIGPNTLTPKVFRAILRQWNRRFPPPPLTGRGPYDPQHDRVWPRRSRRGPPEPVCGVQVPQPPPPRHRAAAAPLEGAPSADLTINMAQARAYIDMARRAGDELKLGGIPTLQWMLEQPGVISHEEQAPLSPDEGWPLLHDGLAKALAELRARRDTEGTALDKELRALLAAMGEYVGVMAARGPAAAERKQQRLRERIQALLGATPLDEGRLATEVAMWAEKSDITEELARLRAHMDEFARLLDEGGAVGRTLDFLIQEMNREVNTVGSKADDLELSQAAITAKSTLEKLREQAQNIE